MSETSNKIEWVYSEKLKAFIKPCLWKMSELSGRKGVVGNMKCSDEMMMGIKVDKKRESSPIVEDLWLCQCYCQYLYTIGDGNR